MLIHKDFQTWLLIALKFLLTATNFYGDVVQGTVKTFSNIHHKLALCVIAVAPCNLSFKFRAMGNCNCNGKLQRHHKAIFTLPTLVCSNHPCSYLWVYAKEIQLTHWGRDKRDAISQKTFSNVFSWMKMYEFRLRFYWNLFLRVQLTICQHWFR